MDKSLKTGGEIDGSTCFDEDAGAFGNEDENIRSQVQFSDQEIVLS